MKSIKHLYHTIRSPKRLIHILNCLNIRGKHRKHTLEMLSFLMPSDYTSLRIVPEIIIINNNVGLGFKFYIPQSCKHLMIANSTHRTTVFLAILNDKNKITFSTQATLDAFKDMIDGTMNQIYEERKFRFRMHRVEIFKNACKEPTDKLSLPQCTQQLHPYKNPLRIARNTKSKKS